MNTNTITITGNVGADAETVQGDKSTRAQARIGCYQGKDKDTMWLGVTAFSGWAFDTLKDVKKGEKICVTGRLTFNPWTDKDGNPRQDWSVVAVNVERRVRSEQPRQQQSGGGRW